MHSTQLSLFAAVKMKQPNVPVFLIYAGIIHAIGLALLLPIVISLPGPDGDVAPETSVINVEIAPATSSAAIIGTDEETAALPSPMGATAAPVVIAPEAALEDTAAGQDSAKEDTAKSVKPARAKKSAATRRAKPATRRATKTQTKIAPFNGALSGLFSPGAPAKRR